MASGSPVAAADEVDLVARELAQAPSITLLAAERSLGEPRERRAQEKAVAPSSV